MRELVLELDNKGPIYVNDDIEIQANLSIDKSVEEDIEYKFMEGFN